MRRKKGNKRILLIVLILFVSIGFAYLTSNLSINGLAIIKKSIWDVHFENITNENEDVLIINNPAIISDNKLKVEYEVTLDQPGQEYSFYIDIVNDSTFDVMINSVEINGLTEEQEKWINNSVTYRDGMSLKKYDLVKECTKEVLRVSTKYLDDIDNNELPNIDNDFSLSLEIILNQADNNAKERNHLEYINRQAIGTVTTGDEIAVGTEHFYVVSSNEENTVLLAKYNLKLGYNYSFDNITKSYTYSTTDEGYGLQDENMLGYIGPGKEAKGTINFSNSKYWYNDGIIDKYKKNIYPEYIYDNSYDLPDGENYSLAYYIKMYIEKLNVIGINNIKGRLLTREEAIELGCSKEEKTCTSSPYPFIYQTSFWLGTSNQNYEDKSYVYTIFNTSFRGNDSNDAWYFGLRPVIEIPTYYLNRKYSLIFNSNGGTAAQPIEVDKYEKETIGERYFKTFEITDITEQHYNGQTSIKEIDDSDSPTGKAYHVERIAVTKSSGPYWLPEKLIINEPYEFNTIVKGKGTWAIQHEQLKFDYTVLKESDGYRLINHTALAANFQYYAIVYYEKSLLSDSYVNIASAEIYHLLPETSREGYTFSGWWTKPDGGTRITHKTLVTKDQTYYAHWIKN